MDNYKVYIHITPDKKVYVGMTQQDIKKRWKSNGAGYISNTCFYNAIKQYGWNNIEHKVLFENLSKEEAIKKEKELIKKYNSTNIEYGYNIVDSFTTLGFHHKEESKKKMSIAKTGKSLINDGSFKKGRTPYNIRKVICIETGKIWDSLKQAQIDMGVSNSYLSSVCKGKRKTCKGYHFAYYQ